MPTKQEMLESKTKAELMKLADKAGVTKVKTNMRKAEIVAVLAKTPKLKKADL